MILLFRTVAYLGCCPPRGTQVEHPADDRWTRFLLVSLPGNDRPLQPKEAVGLARKAAQRALTIDPDLSESYHALGTIASNIDWNWPDAEFNYRRAIELQSDFVPARTGLVTLLHVNARYDDALAEAIAARTIDPISISTGLSLASCYYFRREFSEMDRVLSELPQSSNDSLRIRYIRSYQLFLTGREMEATKMIEEVYLYGTDANKRLFAAPLGYGYARTGQTQKAREILRFVDSQVTYIPAQERATIHLGLREYERGTGLGLAMVKQIVEDHCGRVTAESQLGQGSTFRIFFPRPEDHVNYPQAEFTARPKQSS